MILHIATSQFPVSADISSNRDHILRQMSEADGHGADVVHFPEGALSGYAGVDFDTFDDLDWSLLRSCTEEVMSRAGELDV
jgi:predicted amidohydrolase